jgi:hypothetical protein
MAAVVDDHIVVDAGALQTAVVEDTLLGLCRAAGTETY